MTSEASSLINAEGAERDEDPRVSFPESASAPLPGGSRPAPSLLGGLPETTGMAFLLVQHLDPGHDSLLAEILAEKTLLPVAEVKDGMAVEPDHVYVIPPNTSLESSQAPMVSPHGPGGRSREAYAHRYLVSFARQGARTQRHRGDPVAQRFQWIPRIPAELGRGAFPSLLPTHRGPRCVRQGRRVGRDTRAPRR